MLPADCERVFTGWHVAEQICCAQVPALPRKQRPLQSMRSWTALQLKENRSPSGSSWQVIRLLNFLLVRWLQRCGWSLFESIGRWWHRLSPAGYDLTPTMRDVNKKFSVRYFLNLVLVDEEDRRYFKQQVICRRLQSWRPSECHALFVVWLFACSSSGDCSVEKSSGEAEEKKLPPTLRVARAPNPAGERRAARDVSAFLWTEASQPATQPASQPARYTPTAHCWTARGVKAGDVWKQEYTQPPSITPSSPPPITAETHPHTDANIIEVGWIRNFQLKATRKKERWGCLIEPGIRNMKPYNLLQSECKEEALGCRWPTTYFCLESFFSLLRQNDASGQWF